MAQFSVYENKNPDSCEAYPYLLDVQNALLNSLDTRVVIPVAGQSRLLSTPIERLTPVLTIKKTSHVLLTPQLAAIPAAELGPFVCDLSEYRPSIIGALDFLFTGY
ncbi:CcdB family protein [Desulfoluna sp.]|uniref:CcdB family protein n=1 Tax=Desulfoluna sp. TaxID=2045199 RepID=UPI002631C926|nr:CcdB family protein [Desulfoluna sp.]